MVPLIRLVIKRDSTDWCNKLENFHLRLGNWLVPNVNLNTAHCRSVLQKGDNWIAHISNLFEGEASVKNHRHTFSNQQPIWYTLFVLQRTFSQTQRGADQHELQVHQSYNTLLDSSAAHQSLFTKLLICHHQGGAWHVTDASPFTPCRQDMHFKKTVFTKCTHCP